MCVTESVTVSVCVPGNNECLGKHKHHCECLRYNTVGTRSIKTSFSLSILSWMVRQIYQPDSCASTRIYTEHNIRKAFKKDWYVTNRP